MEREILGKKVINDMEIRENMISDLERALEEEIEKPSKEWESEKIEELSKTIYMLRGDGESNTYAPQEEAVLRKLRSRKLLFKRMYSRVAALAACLMVTFVVIITDDPVYSVMPLPAGCKVSDSDVQIKFEEDGPIDLPMAESDPYGMIAKAAEYNLEPVVPSYIPEGMELTSAEGRVSGRNSYCRFDFRHKKQHIIWTIDKDAFLENRGEPCFGTDTFDVTLEEIGGCTVYIIQNKKSNVAVFVDGLTLYHLNVIHMEYEEFRKILDSLVKSEGFKSKVLCIPPKF